MIIPSTRLFTAGEVQTGAYLNNGITAMSNFALAKPMFEAYQANYLQNIVANIDTAIEFRQAPIIDRDKINNNTTVTATATAISGSGTVVTVTAPNTFMPFDNIQLSGFTTAAYNTGATNAVCLSATSTSFTVSSTATGASSAGSCSANISNRCTIGTQGWYLVSGQVLTSVVANVYRDAFILHRPFGSTTVTRLEGTFNRIFYNSIVGQPVYLETALRLVYFNVGDVIMLAGRGGGNLTTYNQVAVGMPVQSSFLKLHWISL